MAIDFSENPILFSIGTLFSYKIDRKYYHNVHYVWCTSNFNDRKQPITSNPYSICKRYFDQIFSEDRHAKEIADNKAGILQGAQAKFDDGTIDRTQYEEICQLVNLANYEDFFPVLYVIYANKVGNNRCIEVEKKDRASDRSIEYRIFDLSDGEYELIDFKKLLADYIDASDKMAGK